MKTYTVAVDDFKTIEWRNSAGQLHREDGPAVEHADGTKFWYVNDKRHREDGPAIEYSNGIKSWYINGQQLTQAQFDARNKPSCAGKVVEIDGVKYILVKA